MLWITHLLMAAYGLAPKWLPGFWDTTSRQVHPQRGWQYLKRLQFSHRVVRPRHAKADPVAEVPFKKTSLSS